MKRIALIVKTPGLEFDDRIRKEMISAQKVADVSFKIFVMLKDNIASEGVTSYGVPYRSVYIPARDKYPSSSHNMLKAWQFYKAIKTEINDYDAVWCADIGTELTALLVRNKKLLFDCHEIPTHLIGSKVGKILVKKLFNKSRIVLHANPQRIQYLESRGLIKDRTKHLALRNYPDSSEISVVESETWESFKSWVNGRECVYLQGLVEDARAAYECVYSVLATEGLSAVIIGKYDEEALNRLKSEFGSAIEDRIFFTGKIPQACIAQYVERCRFSMVFYKNIRANNWYCEANRFYLAVSLGLPVITGNNPPMKELVEQYHLGISINNDGSDVQIIKSAIVSLRENYAEYADNVKKSKNIFNWHSQDYQIKEIINILIH